MNKVKQFNKKEIKLISDVLIGAKNTNKSLAKDLGKLDSKYKAYFDKEYKMAERALKAFRSKISF